MILILFLLVLLTTVTSIRFSFLETLMPLSKKAHNLCLSLISENSSVTDSLSALVCGQNLDSFEKTSLYIQTGLIHLFVVSGSHLILMNHFLKKIMTSRQSLPCKEQALQTLFLQQPSSQSLFFQTLRWLLLILYAAVCEFNPPVTRSLLSLIVSDYLAVKIKYWSRSYCLLLAGLISLTLQPTWVSSLGLQMSWLAALAIETNQHIFTDKKTVATQMTFFLCYLFIFALFGFPQLSVIVSSFILTPFLELILFPLAFLCLVFPFFIHIFAALEKGLLLLLQNLEFYITPSTFQWVHLEILNWTLIVLLHLFLHLRTTMKTTKT